MPENPPPPSASNDKADATAPAAEAWTARTVTSVHDIGQTTWDRCNTSGHPFTSFAFFSALEDGATLGQQSGWVGQYAVLETPTGVIAAILPLFVKSHSYGEYVFDHSWAQAFERAGGRYYPKLLTAVPFTPATGPRFLTDPALINPALAEQQLAQVAVTLCEKLGLSSWHVNFLDAETAARMGQQGFLIRNDQQFHWFNDGYADFDAFLAALSSRKRKQIRKERRGAEASGLTIKDLVGDDIKPHHWDAFYDFYLDTGARKWGSPYLSKDFFHHMGERMADDILLIMAFDGERPVAGALNIIGDGVLFGRNWGALVDVPYLHFEACYYRAIDFAIRNRFARVEAGAQGQHKLARGYMPSRTYSAHYIAHESFAEAVSNFLEHERTQVTSDMQYLEEFAPFKKSE